MTRLVITGGTGTLGISLLNLITQSSRLTNLNYSEVVVFSRNEASQYSLKKEFADSINCVIGDVRDFEALYKLFEEGDHVIHAAAIKHIDIAERNPEEAIKTNVSGALALSNAAKNRGVERVIGISTDKACNPNSTYGSTKLLAEKIFQSANDKSQTVFSSARFGNLLGSSGSVFHYWKKLLAANNALPVTHKEMTRFFFDVNMAAEFVLSIFEMQQGGETFVPSLSSFRIDDLANFLSNGRPREYVGLRLGEKLHEELINESEIINSFQNDGVFVIKPLYAEDAFELPVNSRSMNEPINSRNFTPFDQKVDPAGKYEMSPLQMQEFLKGI